jgi:DNA gyrase/topoisomerase IV subunit B
MSDDFKVLTDREHALTRPGMYLGSATIEQVTGIIDYKQQTKTIVPALIKMIEEIYQNSVDEFIRTNGKFADKISITFTDSLEGTEICVEDNGRGIPQDTIAGLPRPVHAWTSLRAGSNFDDSTRVGVGANGVGSSLTNIFSTSFKGETSDGKNKLTVVCSNNMGTIKHVSSQSSTRGTKVTFTPDVERFSLSTVTSEHVDLIKDRISNLAILFPGITFKVDNETIKFKSIKEVGKKFHPDAVTIDSGNISMVFAPSGIDEEYRFISYVNGIYVKNGGSHIDFIMNKLIESLREFIKKKHKIEVKPDQIRQHILFGSWITGFPALKFDSQSKERITNTVGEVSVFLSSIDTDKIAKQITSTPAIIDPMIQAILYRKEMAEAKELAKKQKNSKKVNVLNHIAATDLNPENRTIFLTEGLSAIAPFLNVRNPKTMGGYPLKGKPLNITGMRPLEIMKNTELAELMKIIGLELGSEPSNLNYGKIAVFSDNDLDGHHIFGLLLNFFSLWPKLFTERRIYRLRSPLYYCTKGKKTEVFYNKAEYDMFDSKGWQVEYFKGLGSMPESVYDACLNNPRLECVSSLDKEKLVMAFGESAEARKEWMMK